MTGLQPVRLKLSRAAQHMEELKASIREYAGGNPCEVIPESDSKATINISQPPPDAIAVIAGEVLYQLRSALDHLAFELVKLNPENLSLPKGWEEKCEFPIWTELRPGQIRPLAYGVFKSLPGITKNAHTFIELLQPYYGVGATNNCLKFLKGLSNIDKHRHLSLISTRAQVREEVTWASGFRSASLAHFKHGTEIATPFVSADDECVDMQRDVSAAVFFDEPEVLGGAVTVTVGRLLEDILERMVAEILPGFERLMKNP